MPIIPNTQHARDHMQYIADYRKYLSTPMLQAQWLEELTSSRPDMNRVSLIRWLTYAYWGLALTDWYKNGDVQRVKNQFYKIGKLVYIKYVEGRKSGSSKQFTYTNTWDCVPIFLSDHPNLIEWCVASNDGLDDSNEKDKCHTSKFIAKTIYLAMRKQWDEVEERCRRYIENPRRWPFSPMGIFEYRFLLALATGDTQAMENNLVEFASPRGLKSNSSGESGMTDGLISTSGLLFAKLAWMNGYEVNINSPYIPQEWLPVQPLDHYEDEFDFMEAYTIDPTKGATSI